MVSLLDEFCPSYLVCERHRTRVRAERETLLRVVRALDFSGSWLTRALFRLRGLPVTSFDVAGLSEIGLRELAVRNDEVLIGGLVGTNFRPVQASPRELLRRSPPHVAVLAWNFRLEPLPDGSLELHTETRVHCKRRWVAALFLPYWVAIRPFSGLIRRDMLRLLKAQAEQASRDTVQPVHA
jgi:Protein of unknown function (DUF2867)